MNKTTRVVSATAMALAGVAVAYSVGYESAQNETGPIDVSITYEESGEVRTVSLTDSEGLDIPTGEVEEHRPWVEKEN